jgi:hypothetical protein
MALMVHGHNHNHNHRPGLAGGRYNGPVSIRIEESVPFTAEAATAAAESLRNTAPWSNWRYGCHFGNERHSSLSNASIPIFQQAHPANSQDAHASAQEAEFLIGAAAGRPLAETETEAALCGRKSFLFFACFCFIGVLLVGTIVMVVLTARGVSEVVSELDPATLSNRLDTILLTVQAAADNTADATRRVGEMAKASQKMFSESSPMFVKAVNQSASMVSQMSEYSKHPSLSIVAG